LGRQRLTSSGKIDKAGVDSHVEGAGVILVGILGRDDAGGNGEDDGRGTHVDGCEDRPVCLG
jgi:hypothetical protein